MRVSIGAGWCYDGRGEIVHTRRSALAALAGAPLAWTCPALSREHSQTTPSLAAAARTRGCYFGAAVRIDQIEADPGLRNMVLRDCSALAPEIHFKWDQLEPREGHHIFNAADGLADFAHAHGLALRGHTLLWDQSTPRWAKSQLLHERDWTLVARHFEIVLSRYRDRVREWDVVNEPIDSESGEAGLRANAFLRTFGPGYIGRALTEARRLAPDACLMINDYGFDYDNPVEAKRRRSMLRLVERLKREGAPLDGIGVQAHLDLSKGPFRPAPVREFLQELAQFGIEIVITEFDVRESDRSAPLDLRDRRVADEARAYLEVALDQPAVRGVVTWGLSDRHSWLQDQRRGLPRVEAARSLNRGLPYDAAFNPKPMYWSMHEAFRKV
jgi:endo-1,4-beta-xylanase